MNHTVSVLRKAPLLLGEQPFVYDDGATLGVSLKKSKPEKSPNTLGVQYDDFSLATDAGFAMALEPHCVSNVTRICSPLGRASRTARRLRLTAASAAECAGTRRLLPAGAPAAPASPAHLPLCVSRAPAPVAASRRSRLQSVPTVSPGLRAVRFESGARPTAARASTTPCRSRRNLEMVIAPHPDSVSRCYNSAFPSAAPPRSGLLFGQGSPLEDHPWQG